MRSLTILIVLLLLIPDLIAQKRCGFDHKSHQEPVESFENWILQLKKSAHSRISMDEVLVIPVVVHVLHNGEPLGIDGNISDERVFGQIDILNADFGRTNADTSLTPLEFRTVAANTAIQFALARRDPEGLPTNGITRMQGDQSSYNINEDVSLKANIQWPPDDYLNIYVANLSGLIGWAEFPFSNIGGVPDINTDPSRDGVVIDHRFFGVNPNTGSFASFGRTATHEVGHYLGLRHVWGDGGCDVDDFCEDTPASRLSYSGSCPDTEQSSCESNDMYSNYLFLTDDACMNIFTQCQKARMRTVLENSPRRASLLLSRALNTPVQVANDLGIQRVLMPPSGSCDESVTPAIIVRNYGNNTINRFEVALSNGAGTVAETQMLRIRLEPLDTTTVNFAEISVAEDQALQFTISSVNSTSDGNNDNDSVTITVASAQMAAVPFLQDFEVAETSDLTLIGDESQLMTLRQAPIDRLENQALAYEFFEEDRAFGLKQHYIVPEIPLSQLSSAEITFDYAYGNDSTEAIDGLALAYSVDCGASFPESQYLFRSFGDELQTTSRSIGGAFVPIGPSEWRSVSVNITQLLSIPNLRFALIGVNGTGNNIYIDNVVLTPTNLNAYDLAIGQIQNFPVVTCQGDFTFSTTITNVGFETITGFDLQYSINGIAQSSSVETNLLSGEGDNFIFQVDGLAPQDNEVSITLTNLNGENDQAPGNNLISRSVVVDTSTDLLPIRQTFETVDGWVLSSPNGGSDFRHEQDGEWIRAAGYDNPAIGRTSWLVSPTFSTDGIVNGSLVFDLAYAAAELGAERLQVLLSISCGERFEETLLDLSSAELVTSDASGAFQPSSPSDWQRIILDIDRFVAFRELRFAFVFTNGGGNDLFLDNVEFVPTSASSLLTFQDPLRVYPNPASTQFHATLNLPTRESAIITLLDIQGRVILKFLEPEALNQTFDFEVSDPGIYFVQVRAASSTSTERIIIR